MDRMIEHLRKEYKVYSKTDPGRWRWAEENLHVPRNDPIDYTVPGQVKTTMFGYIEEIPTAFDKVEPESGGTKVSAAPDNLFTVKVWL